MSHSFQFTRADFLREFHAFRQLMGERTFWAKPFGVREKAVKGFSFVYLNADLLPEDVTTFDSTLQEYGARERMSFMAGLTTM